MWRFIFIAFLIAHGALHPAIWGTPPKEDAPFDVHRSWLLGSRRSLSRSLAALIGGVLVVAGIAIWVGADWWRLAAVAGLSGSFGLMVLFFNRWYLFIQAVNAALVVGLVWLDWPSASMVGA